MALLLAFYAAAALLAFGREGFNAFVVLFVISNLLHFTCASLSEHLKTMDRYTTLAAEQLIAADQQVSWGRLILEPPWTFFRTYVLKAGFLDEIGRAHV